MANQPGARRQKFETEFMEAMRGIGLASVKKALREEVPSALLYESTKANLASRYAKGKMSLGGSQESQAFRRMDIYAVGVAARRIHDARTKVAANVPGRIT